MRAATQITDRAKRYRAVKTVTGPKVCVLCGARPSGGRPLDVMHLSGNEADGEQKNLAYGCRSCNGTLAAAFKSIGAGVPTNQYNPASNAAPSFAQYAWAVSQGGPGGRNHSGEQSKRIEYARRIAEKARGTKRAKADERWNPGIVDKAIATARRSAKKHNQPVIIASTYLGPKLFFKGQKKLAYSQDFIEVSPDGLYTQGRQNPADASAEVFEEFHGYAPKELVTVKKRVHHHKHLAAAGELVGLQVRPIGRGLPVRNIEGLGDAFLCFNERKNQLFVEGGDQALSPKELKSFGVTADHELQTLGKLVGVGYYTDKKHLGDEGGEATYSHEFRTTNENGRHVRVKIARYPDLIYRVVEEQFEISGGSYTIRAEGIDV